MIDVMGQRLPPSLAEPVAAHCPHMASTSESLLPREHGAYGELVFPMLSALAAGSPRLGAFAFTAGAVLAFLAHEPLLVWAGQRGSRLKREQAARALRRGLVLGALAAAFYALGLVGASEHVAPAAAIAVVLGVAGFGVALAGREKTVWGELLAAVALSSAALPVALAAGLPLSFAIALVMVWSVSFGVGTAAARGIALRSRDHGRSLRIAAVAAVVVALVAAGLAVGGFATIRAAAAPVPTLLLALALAIHPVAPAKIRKVGWSMIAASALTLLVLAVPMGAQ